MFTVVRIVEGNIFTDGTAEVHLVVAMLYRSTSISIDRV